MKTLLVLAAALAFAAFAAPAAAQQYKWVDQDGKTRYGDVPPPGVKATRMKPPATGSAPAAPAGAAKKDAKKDEKPLTPEQAFQKRQKEQREEEEKAAKDRVQADAKRANCEGAQNQLRALEGGQRISRTDAKGERYMLEEAQVAQELAKARQGVQQWCN